MTNDFDKFYAAYPKKKTPADARKAWAQTAQIRPPIEVILTAISAACESEQWRENNGKYIPYPATWLRGECWNDEQEVQIANPTVKQEAWLASDEKTIQHGQKIGIPPRPGESMYDYKQRLSTI